MLHNCSIVPYIFLTSVIFISAKAEKHKNLGNSEFRKKEYATARDLYTEGIKLNCKDQELSSKLYSNRATAHFYLGKNFFCNDYTKYLHWNANVAVI